MRSKTSTWFECKVQYDKTLDNGQIKSTKEAYIVDALSFTEAETSIFENLSPFVSGEFEVIDIKKTPYKEVFFADSSTADKWFKAKLQFITVTDSGAEKKTSVNFLIQAECFNEAVSSISDIMKGSMEDYITATVTETAIMDVFEHTA